MTNPTISFPLRQPAGLVCASESELTDLRQGDLALCGYFCDNLCGGPAGARFLARQIRYYSDEVGPVAGVHDLGDLNVFPLEPGKHQRALHDQFDLIAATGARPVLVGGDASGLNALAGYFPAAVIHDASCSDPPPADKPLILSVDLARPGASCGDRSDEYWKAAIAPLRGAKIVAAAVFGLAPELDWRGADDTRLARDVLAEIVREMSRKEDYAAT
jgi:hypothetical protein